MNLYFNILLGIHILAGTAALISGAIAMVTAKGKMPHRRSGRIYHLSMILVGLTALAMSIWQDNAFLLGVAVFTLYMVYTGKRLVRRKKSDPRWLIRLDDAFIGAGCLGGGFLLFDGLSGLIFRGAGMNIVASVFGAITLVFVIRDLVIRKKGKQYAYKENLMLHIGRMGGSYIATFTAFVVTNIHLEPGWILWLVPTVVGSILISAASRRWRKRLFPPRNTSSDLDQTISPADLS